MSEQIARSEVCVPANNNACTYSKQPQNRCNRKEIAKLKNQKKKDKMWALKSIQFAHPSKGHTTFFHFQRIKAADTSGTFGEKKIQFRWLPNLLHNFIGICEICILSQVDCGPKEKYESQLLLPNSPERIVRIFQQTPHKLYVY